MKKRIKIIIALGLLLNSFTSYAQEPKYWKRYSDALSNPDEVAKICITCSHHDFPLEMECFELPDNFELFRNLSQLMFNEAKFEYLPKSINKLPRLKKLFIDLNDNVNYETELCKLVGLDSLEYLSLQMNNINNLPSCLSKLQSLKGINIGFNPNLNLRAAFDLFSEFDSLCYINLSGFKSRKRFPKSIKNIASLKYLDLNFSEKLNLKNTINRLKPLKLKGLSLKFCRLGSLPDNILDLGNLEHLNLSNNNFTAIPAQVYELTGLKTLIIEDSFSFSEGLAQINEKIRNLDQLEILSLQQNFRLCDTKDLEYISYCTNLIELYLYGTGYKEIPNSFAKLINLEKLEFYGAGNLVSENNKNRILILAQLPKLKYLSTNFESVPNEIGLLTELEYLNILGSKVKDLPDEFYTLKKLKFLNIYEPKLKPECLERIKNEMPNCSVTNHYTFHEEVNYRY